MTDGNKAYQLDTGTILDGRYEIGRVLGEGGFGITYAGTNIRIGREVAIKEFFCLDYMNRANDGVSVILTDKGARKRFNTERARFMKEARILGEFKDEPGVVTVLDYFEAGGTAYLVMEYLNGVTLHDYVKTHGTYDPNVFFEEIRPLMHTLAKVHEAGVIHRDISPDNIMRMDDGSIVLIDFGSAKDLSGKTVTTAAMYKEGYAPPEQYASGKKLGPETDVYALAATFYYCLTGVKPESAIQRIMLDELRPLHELAGGIPDDIEQMIAKGMSLMQTDRFKTVTEMEDIIEARYPLLTPEEKERIRRRKKTRRMVLAAAGVILLALLTVNIIRNSTLYRMRMQDTQMVYLNWESADDDETIKKQQVAEEIIKDRLGVFAGKNNYLWSADSKENMIGIEIPETVLLENEPSALFRKYITRTVAHFSVMYANEEGVPKYYEKKGDEYIDLPKEDITKDDIEEAELGEGIIPTGAETRARLPYLKIVLKNPSDGMKKEFLNESGKLLAFLINQEDLDSFYIPCFAEGDGRSLYLILQESVDEKELREVLQNASLGDGSITPEAHLVEGERFRQLLKYDIEHDASEITPKVTPEPSVTWETPDNMLAGDNQITESEIKGEAILTEWTCGDYEITESDWINTIAVLRARLDALDVPYAFGITPYDKNRAVIKVAEKDVTQAELLLLEWSHNLCIYNGLDDESLSEARLIKVGSGKEEHIELNGIPSYAIEDVKALVKQAKERKTESLTVSLGYDGAFPVGQIKVSDVTDEHIERGRLPLSEFGIGGSDEKDKAARDRLLEFVNAVLIESSSDSLNLERTARLDSKGRFERYIEISEIKGGFYPEKQEVADKLNKEIQAASGNEPGFNVEVRVSSGDFYMIVYDGSLSTENFEEEVVKRTEYLLTKYDLAKYEIETELRISNSVEVIKAGDKGVQKLAILYLGRLSKYDTEDKIGEYGLNSGNHVQIYKDNKRDDGEAEEEATALLEKLIRESDILGKLVG